MNSQSPYSRPPAFARPPSTEQNPFPARRPPFQHSAIPSPVDRRENPPYTPSYGLSPRRPSPPTPREDQTHGRPPQSGFLNGYHSRQPSLNEGTRNGERPPWLDSKMHNQGGSFHFFILSSKEALYCLCYYHTGHFTSGHPGLDNDTNSLDIDTAISTIAYPRHDRFTAYAITVRAE